MTTERSSSESSKLDNLEARVRGLRQSIAQQHKKAAKKRTKYLVAGSVLTLVSCFGLGSITSLVSKLDAQAVTQIGRQHVERHLPTGTANFATYLSTEAPTVVKHTLRSLLLDLLPQLRLTLVKHLDQRLTRMVREGETLLVAEMQEAIKTSKISLETRYPDLDDKEILTQLVAVVAETFSEKIDALLWMLYPQYEAEIRRVHDFVNGLATSDDQSLTPKERTQKELIRSLLRLIAMEQSKSRK